MLRDLIRAAGMLTDRRVQRTFLLSLVVAVVLLAGMFPATSALIRLAGSTGYPWIDRILEVVGLAGTAVIAWFLFPVIVAATLGFLLDAVAAATERRHLPALAPSGQQPLVQSILYSVGFALLVLVVNVAALPLYLVPGLNIPVYLTINSYLLGREYVELVLARRHPFAGLKRVRAEHRSSLWLSGLVTALLLLIPVVNLLAPIIGSAFATLRVHRGATRQIETV